MFPSQIPTEKDTTKESHSLKDGKSQLSHAQPSLPSSSQKIGCLGNPGVSKVTTMAEDIAPDAVGTASLDPM